MLKWLWNCMSASFLLEEVNHALPIFFVGFDAYLNTFGVWNRLGIDESQRFHCHFFLGMKDPVLLKAFRSLNFSVLDALQGCFMIGLSTGDPVPVLLETTEIVLVTG